ncbi:ATP-binding cassette domain-containing protein [Micrococcales bacterium 31B]|nr:ATP-binding cassette domain-containing protein [Micrococcales bacterium 31B]
MLRITNLSAGYPRRRVIDDLTWNVPSGKTVLLGPNGAGKSTLMTVLAGARYPRRGRVTLGDYSPQGRRSARVGYLRRVSWMPQQVAALGGMTAFTQVAYSGWLKGMTRGDAASAAHEALRHVGLEASASAESRTLSGGQLRRLALAQALVSSPDVLILDEPTVGLDVKQRARFREYLADISPDRSVLVSTHQTDDLHEIFDTVIVFYRGTIVWQGGMSDFLSHATPGETRPAESAYVNLLPGEE